MFLKILLISQKNTFVGASPQRETPTQVFSREIFKVFKTTYFKKYLQTAASVLPKIYKT